jgi:peroxiredoxin Q/BCP
MAKRIELNKTVPDFKLPSSSGEDFTLKSQKGKYVVLYFYPRDSTPGCTLEGQEFNKYLSHFKKLKVEIYGVSRDSLKSHQKFIDKCGFKFDLLSDEEEKLCQLFDVIKEKNMYGKKVMGIERSTFIIGPDQKLLAEFRKVKAEGHAEEVLQKIKSL